MSRPFEDEFPVERRFVASNTEHGSMKTLPKLWFCSQLPTTLVNQHSHGNSSSFLVNTIQNGRWCIAMLGYQSETPGSLTARPLKFAIPKGSRIVFQPSFFRGQLVSPPLQVSINGGEAKHVRRDLAAEMLGVVPKFEGKRTTPFVGSCWKCQGSRICIIDFRVYVMKHTS